MANYGSNFHSTDKAGSDSRKTKYAQSTKSVKAVTEVNGPGQKKVKGPGGGK